MEIRREYIVRAGHYSGAIKQYKGMEHAHLLKKKKMDFVAEGKGTSIEDGSP